MFEWPLVSVILVTWNNRVDLQRCLPSLMAQRYPYCEIIVVDNDSSDGTADWITSDYSNIRLLRNKDRIGFAAAVNQGFAAARGDVLVELNPETTVEPNWLIPLVEAFAEPRVGLVTSRVMLMQEPESMNTCGNEISSTNLTFCIDVGEEVERYSNLEMQSVSAISGAAFAISRDCYETIGDFDVDYFASFEACDLSSRAYLAGFERVLAANSVVYHDYGFSFSPRKMDSSERRRPLTELKPLQWNTLPRLRAASLFGNAIASGYALQREASTLIAKAKTKVQAFGSVVRHFTEVRSDHEGSQVHIR